MKNFFARPQGVWERSFPVGSSSPFRGGRKGDPDTKVVWEQSRAARRKFLLYCTPFCLENISLYPFFRAQREESFFIVSLFFLSQFYCAPFCLEKVCVLKIGFPKFSNFQLKVFSS